MGLPAARAGDQTSHGQPLGPSPGAANVKINGMPAWRAVLDVHMCSLSDGPKPHVGGIVSRGSATVKINGMAAVRVGDMVTEAGPPNAIVKGATTVFIG